MKAELIPVGANGLEEDRAVRVLVRTRVLASLARLSPRMAGVVAAAGREIWQLDRDDRQRQSKATRKARQIWARVEVYGELP